MLRERTRKDRSPSPRGAEPPVDDAPGSKSSPRRGVPSSTESTRQGRDSNPQPSDYSPDETPEWRTKRSVGSHPAISSTRVLGMKVNPDDRGARRAIHVRVASGNPGRWRGLAGYRRKGPARAFTCFPWSEDRFRAALGAGGRVFKSLQPDKENPLNKRFFVVLWPATGAVVQPACHSARKPRSIGAADHRPQIVPLSLATGSHPRSSCWSLARDL